MSWPLVYTNSDLSIYISLSLHIYIYIYICVYIYIYIGYIFIDIIWATWTARRPSVLGLALATSVAGEMKTWFLQNTINFKHGYYESICYLPFEGVLMVFCENQVYSNQVFTPPVWVTLSESDTGVWGTDTPPE